MMTPDERQLLAGLFDRIRSSGNQQRDRDAEAFITDAVRQQPYAPYLLSQTVIVQEQALRAASDKLQELEAKVKSLEGAQPGASSADSGFLGGLGRSIFGSSQPQQQRPSVPAAGYAPQGSYGQGGQAQGGPWAQAAPQQGGSFLKGALGAAAGVAGGVLLANSISGLFHGSNNPFGIASGMGGMGGFGNEYPGGGETVVNNYYGNDDQGGDPGSADSGGFDNAADFGSDNGNFGSDDGSYDV